MIRNGDAAVNTLRAELAACLRVRDPALASRVPCLLGVITCDTREQAQARARGDKPDQGPQAAGSVVALAPMRARG